MACPDGNAAPVVAVRLSGGRGRSTPAFTSPMSASLVTTASTKAARRSQCRRHASRSIAATRSGQFTKALPSQERAIATAVVGLFWIVPANRHTASSTPCTAGRVAGRT
jgi:hypothetical protein